MILMMILGLYTAFVIWLSYKQISFLKSQKQKQAIILEKQDYEKAADIAIANEKFNIFSNFYTLFINLCWLTFGFWYLKEFFIHENSKLENTLFLLVFLLITSFLNLPLAAYKTFVQDKAHGFSNTNLTLFIKDSLKSLVLLVVFGFIILYVLLFCYEFFASWWWIAAFIFSFVIILITNLIYPILIVPIFNKMQKLDDENLNTKISTLLNKCGFSANGVYVIDASKRDTRLNAYFGGLFKSKRVVLFDTLLKALSEKELLAVLGHELGHFVHKDILKALFGSALMLFVLFFVFAHLGDFAYKQSHLEGVNAGVFALLIMFGNVFVFIFQPFLNALSRVNEFNADKFGAKMSSKEDMKNALIALARENKAFVKASKIYSFFYFSHPSISDRIKALS